MTVIAAPCAGEADSSSVAPTDNHLQLFATERYNRRNLDEGQQYFRTDYYSSKRHVGTFAGVIDEGLFWSGYRAPVCGPDLVRDRETARHVEALIEHAISALRATGVRRMRVTAKPVSYSRNEVYVQHAFLQQGLTIAQSELSYSIDVGGFRSRADYRLALKSPARRAVRHSDGQPYDYGEATTESEWAAAYELIRSNRAAKGYHLALSLEYILRLRADFGERIRFFLLRHAGQPVASALLYRLRPDIELVEYWGDSHNLDRSPMNRIAEEVCVRAIEEGVRLVELGGVPTIDGSPDEGLIQFKQSIGATAELRLTFEGEL